MNEAADAALVTIGSLAEPELGTWHTSAHIVYLFLLQHMAITASMYMVLIIALERQQAILHPFKKTPSFTVCSMFLLFLSISLNLSKFLEFKVKESYNMKLS